MANTYAVHCSWPGCKEPAATQQELAPGRKAWLCGKHSKLAKAQDAKEPAHRPAQEQGRLL